MSFNYKYKLIEEKLKILDEDEFIKLLSSRSIVYKPNRTFINYHLVTNEEQARPDIVSEKYFYGQENEDILLKFNGISNPYSLEEGDYVFIPSYTQNSTDRSIPSLNQEDISENEDFRLKFKDIISDEKSKIQEFNDTFSKKVDELYLDGSNLPPNIADFGDKQFTIKGGKVYFAPDLSKCAIAKNGTITQGELIAKLIKNKISS